MNPQQADEGISYLIKKLATCVFCSKIRKKRRVRFHTILALKSIMIIYNKNCVELYPIVETTHDSQLLCTTE